MKLKLGELVIAEIYERFNYTYPPESMGWEIEVASRDYINSHLDYLSFNSFSSYAEAKKKFLAILPKKVEKFIVEQE